MDRYRKWHLLPSHRRNEENQQATALHSNAAPPSGTRPTVATSQSRERIPDRMARPACKAPQQGVSFSAQGRPTWSRRTPPHITAHINYVAGTTGRASARNLRVLRDNARNVRACLRPSSSGLPGKSSECLQSAPTETRQNEQNRQRTTDAESHQPCLKSLENRGASLVRDEGVAGSNPATPTNTWLQTNSSRQSFRQSNAEHSANTTRERVVSGALSSFCSHCRKEGGGSNALRRFVNCPKSGLGPDAASHRSPRRKPSSPKITGAPRIGAAS